MTLVKAVRMGKFAPISSCYLIYERKLLFVSGELWYINYMQIAVSIEPYLAVEKVKLIQYIENIIKIAQKNQRVCLHFDYFKPNQDAFRLVQSYTRQIDIDLHLMQEPAPSVVGFRSVSYDVKNSERKGLMDSLRMVSSQARGLVLDLGCVIDNYENLIRTAKYIIVMTVKCGKSGQVFQASALKLIPKVRQLNPQAVIIVDGGVNESNIHLLKEAGVDVAVVGNYAKQCYENGTLEIGINRLLHN